MAACIPAAKASSTGSHRPDRCLPARTWGPTALLKRSLMGRCLVQAHRLACTTPVSGFIHRQRHDFLDPCQQRLPWRLNRVDSSKAAARMGPQYSHRYPIY
ncbi:hypothetical protein D3C81_1998610 [compost metagenome]